VFYQTNTFLVTQKCQCKLSIAKHDKHCANASRVLDSWLDRLGSQRFLVKNIWLDKYSLCLVHCPDYYGQNNWALPSGKRLASQWATYAFLPLLRVVWKHSLRASVSVAMTMSCDKYGPQDYQTFFTLSAMSVALQAFCNDDIGIARFQRTLGCIAIRGDGSGDIVHWTTSRHAHIHDKDDGSIAYETIKGTALATGHVCMHSRTPFFLGDDQLRLSHKKDNTALSVLPQDIHCKIWTSFMQDMTTILIDLDTETDFTTLFPILYINRNLRRLYVLEILQKPYLLLLSSTSTRPRFANTSKLKRLLNTTIEYSPYNFTSVASSQWHYGMLTYLHFKLAIKHDAPIKLHDLRIHILPFVVASSSTWNDCSVTIALDASGFGYQVAVLKLGLLRRRVLKALKEYGKEHPNDDEPCPDIWVNGYGQVREVVEAVEASTSIEHGGVNIMGLEGQVEHVSPGMQPPYPVHGRLDSTILYLTWVLRHWQKAK
jgi:hypothetical protein